MQTDGSLTCVLGFSVPEALLEPCRRCRTPVELMKEAGRNSFCCPQ